MVKAHGSIGLSTMIGSILTSCSEKEPQERNECEVQGNDNAGKNRRGDCLVLMLIEYLIFLILFDCLFYLFNPMLRYLGIT